MDAKQLVITTADGRVLHAQKLWSDRKSDVAVIGITEPDVPTAELGDSDTLHIGHWVLAIGNPFDLAGSVTAGIVSGKGRRSLGLGGGNEVINQDFIQTDASINPGNSGGPLVNLRGEVVGINTAIASQSGLSEGVGFAIPINMARRVAAKLVTQGEVQRAFLGIQLTPPLDAATAEQLGLTRVRGAIIQQIIPGTPAEKVGMQRRDVIVKIDNKPIEDAGDLMNVISMKPIGTEVTLTVWRDRKEQSFAVRLMDRAELDRRAQALLGSADPDGGKTRLFPALGIELQELTDADRQQLGYPAEQKGVLVARIAPHCPAAQFIDMLNVIDQVERRPVASIAEFEQAIQGLDVADGFMVRVLRPSSGKEPEHKQVILRQWQ